MLQNKKKNISGYKKIYIDITFKFLWIIIKKMHKALESIDLHTH